MFVFRGPLRPGTVSGACVKGRAEPNHTSRQWYTSSPRVRAGSGGPARQIGEPEEGAQMGVPMIARVLRITARIDSSPDIGIRA